MACVQLYDRQPCLHTLMQTRHSANKSAYYLSYFILLNIAVVRVIVYNYITIFPQQPSRERCFQRTNSRPMTSPTENLCAGILFTRIFLLFTVWPTVIGFLILILSLKREWELLKYSLFIDLLKRISIHLSNPLKYY